MTDPWTLVGDEIAAIELPGGVRLYRGGLVCACGNPSSVHDPGTGICRDPLCGCTEFRAPAGSLVFEVRPDIAVRFGIAEAEA